MVKDVLFVLIPCYNEEENIESLVRAWQQQTAKLLTHELELRLVLVNDGSTDNTYALAKAIEKQSSNIVVLDHQGNKGLGEALNTGINYVLMQEHARYLCIMDGDMTQHPVFVHSMVIKLEEEGLDCVIASRYRHGSRIEGLSFFRRFLSFGARALYTYKLRVPGVRDYTCGYRLYRVDALRHLQGLHGKSIVKERSFACMLELLIYLHKEGCRLGEVPFVLKYQMKHGHSKMRVLKTIGRSLKVLRKG